MPKIIQVFINNTPKELPGTSTAFQTAAIDLFDFVGNFITKNGRSSMFGMHEQTNLVELWKIYWIRTSKKRFCWYSREWTNQNWPVGTVPHLLGCSALHNTYIWATLCHLWQKINKFAGFSKWAFLNSHKTTSLCRLGANMPWSECLPDWTQRLNFIEGDQSHASAEDRSASPTSSAPVREALTALGNSNCQRITLAARNLARCARARGPEALLDEPRGHEADAFCGSYPVRIEMTND